MFCAFSTECLKDNSRIKQIGIMGIIFSGMFGVALSLCIHVGRRALQQGDRLFAMLSPVNGEGGGFGIARALKG
ncbi:hypothetical protein [Enterobacter asburiae]|uniref:hypothetical protein n=1 Tax=Enterobacter asburiae TaxID=61645 RepID=UPI003B2270C9